MKNLALLIIFVLDFLPMMAMPSSVDGSSPETKQEAKARKKEVKKALEQAKASLKSGSNLQGVESSINKLLQDSLNQNDERLYLALYDVLKKQYQQGNEKLFLKQKYDTASLFLTARKMFLLLDRFDSIDALPDEKGRIALKYRKDHAFQLSHFYHNLYTGGIYFQNHQKYDEAVQFMDTYLSAPHWPLFSATKISPDSTVAAHASSVSLVAGYKKGDFPAALKYKDLALKYSPRLELSLQCLSDIYYQQKDTMDCLRYLRMGVDSFPVSSFFFPRLVGYYCDEGEYKEALSLTERVMKADTADIMLRVTHQTLLLNLARYEECINEGMMLLSRNDSIAEVNYNIALAYYNKALEMESNTKLMPAERTRNVNALYRKCRPYMERYRALAPEEKDRWRPVLYTIYLNLNLGKEFSEIE